MARLLPLIAIGVVAPVAAARAQSVRYPPDAADADREAESHSALWDSAVDPERAPYEQLVRDARRALELQTEQAAHMAVDKLSDAIRRLPSDPRAYGLRGEAYLALKDWAHCADDLAAADKLDVPPSDRDRLEIELGICQGRAGHYADAEHTLVHAAERSPHGETWLRLGEVRIALGRLDEAIDALTAALETPEGRSPVTHWLLALAYDRARRPGPERGDNPPATDAQLALAEDNQLGTIVNPQYPWLGAGEREYLMALAYTTKPVSFLDTSSPELALLYFRRFLAVAPESPWHGRAVEHMKALTALVLPQAVHRSSNSSAIVETSLIRAAIVPVMPALRACLSKQPTVAYEITMVRDAPKSPDAADRTRVALRPETTTIKLDVDIGDSPTSSEDVTRACLAANAAKIALPIPKERDTWYQTTFVVIAP
ncbi:MAG TPA: tetratricopeptide repeat protein [Kofleriaceae bacterium]